MALPAIPGQKIKAEDINELRARVLAAAADAAASAQVAADAVAMLDVFTAPLDAQVDFGLDRAETQGRLLSPSDASRRFADQVIVQGPGVDPTGATASTAAVKALIEQAAAERKRLYWPAGTYLIDGNLIDGGTIRSYIWEGQRSERGANAEAQSPGYAAVKIRYRPADPSVPMVRCFSLTEPLSAIIGPFEHRNIHFDLGGAHGFVFGVENHTTPGVVAPAIPNTVTDGDGQRYVFGVRFEGCALRGTNANRVSVNGVLTRSGQRLLSMTKCFESKLDEVSITGGDIQVRTWGCDKPVFRHVRSQQAHLPFDLNGSGSFAVMHTLHDVQVEGWTFTPIRSRGCSISGLDLRWEQNDGNPTGSGRFAIPGTVAVTADSPTLTFSQNMNGILWPGLSLLELTDGTNKILALVTAVDGATVTIDVTTTTITWSAALASATRIHGYGPFHQGVTSATFVNISGGASANCPGAVWMVSRGSMSLVNWLAASGAFGDISAAVIGNRHGDQANMQGVMMFTNCSSLVTPDPANPFVDVTGIRPGLGWPPSQPNERTRWGSIADAELPLRRRWVFTPKQAWFVFNSQRAPIVSLPDEANTLQRIWAWHVRTASLMLNDETLPSNPANLVRLRVRARSVGPVGSVTLATTGNGGGTGVTFPLTDQFATHEAVVAMPTHWQGQRTATGTVGFHITDDDIYVAGVLVEEINPREQGAFPGGVQTLIKAGAPVNADFNGPPREGMTVVDSANNRLYVRVSGVWRFTSLT